jgi:hypothetical protein
MARVELLILEIQLLSIEGAQVVQNVTLLTMVGIAIGNVVFIITRA